MPIIFIVISSDAAQYDGNNTQDTKNTFTFHIFFFQPISIWPIFNQNLQKQTLFFCYGKKLSWMVHIYTQLAVVIAPLKSVIDRENSSLRVCISVLVLLLTCHSFRKRFFLSFSATSLRIDEFETIRTSRHSFYRCDECWNVCLVFFFFFESSSCEFKINIIFDDSKNKLSCIHTFMKYFRMKFI